MGIGPSRVTYASDPNCPIQLPPQFQQLSSVQGLRTEVQVREAVAYLKGLLHEQTEYTKCKRRQAENDDYLDRGRTRRGHGDRGRARECCSGRSFREGQTQAWCEGNREALQDLKRQVEEQGRYLRDQGGRCRNTDRYDDRDDLKRERDCEATRLRERDRERERDRDKDRQAERDRDRERERLRWEQTYFDSRYQPYQPRELPSRGCNHIMIPPPPQPRTRHGPPPSLPMMMPPMPIPMPMMMPPQMAGPTPRGFGNGQRQGMYYDDFGMRGPRRRRRRPPFMNPPDVQQMKSDPPFPRQAQPNATQSQDDASFDRLRPGGFGPRTRLRRAKATFREPPVFGGGNGGDGPGGERENDVTQGRDIFEDFFAESKGSEGGRNGKQSFSHPNLGQRAQRRRDFKNFGGGGGREDSPGGGRSQDEDQGHGQFQRERNSSREPVIEEIVDENNEEDGSRFGNAADNGPNPTSR